MPSYALEDKVGEKRDGRGIVAKTKVKKGRNPSEDTDLNFWMILSSGSVPSEL